MASSDTNIRDAIEFAMVLLREESDSQQFNECISTVLKIFRNVLNNPGETKYKEIKTCNKAFREKVWKFQAAQQLLIASGWSEVEGRVILLDDQYVTTAVQTLQQNHSQVEDNKASDDTTPQPVNRIKTGTNQILDENRRKQAEQMKREKEERKRINEQIQADRRETQNRPTKPSVARPRQFGSNLNRFEDIGVDLNKGGG